MVEKEDERGFYRMSAYSHTIIPVVTGPFWKRIFLTAKGFLSLGMSLADTNPRHGKMYSEQVRFRDAEDKEILQQHVHIVFVDSIEAIPETVAESCKLLEISDNKDIGVTLFKIYGKTKKPNDPQLLEICHRILELLPGAGVGIL